MVAVFYLCYTAYITSEFFSCTLIHFKLSNSCSHFVFVFTYVTSVSAKRRRISKILGKYCVSASVRGYKKNIIITNIFKMQFLNSSLNINIIRSVAVIVI